jgi:hypothetical protein
MNRALETLEMINSTWYLKLSWGSKKTPKNLIAGILERELICSILCTRLGFSTSTFGELLFIKRSTFRFNTALLLENNMNFVLSKWRDSLFTRK